MALRSTRRPAKNMLVIVGQHKHLGQDWRSADCFQSAIASCWPSQAIETCKLPVWNMLASTETCSFKAESLCAMFIDLLLANQRLYALAKRPGVYGLSWHDATYGINMGVHHKQRQNVRLIHSPHAANLSGVQLLGSPSWIENVLEMPPTFRKKIIQTLGKMELLTAVMDEFNGT